MQGHDADTRSIHLPYHASYAFTHLKRNSSPFTPGVGLLWSTTQNCWRVQRKAVCVHSIGDRTLEIVHLLIKGSQMSKSASNYGNRISSQNVLSKSLSLVVGGMLILGNKLSHAEADSAYTMLSEKNCTVFHSSNEPEVGGRSALQWPCRLQAHHA